MRPFSAYTAKDVRGSSRSRRQLGLYAPFPDVSISVSRSLAVIFDVEGRGGVIPSEMRWTFVEIRSAMGTKKLGFLELCHREFRLL